MSGVRRNVPLRLTVMSTTLECAGCAPSKSSVQVAVLDSAVANAESARLAALLKEQQMVSTTTFTNRWEAWTHRAGD